MHSMIKAKKMKKAAGGTVIVLTLAGLTAILGVIGLAIDLGLMFDYKQRAQMAADAGADAVIVSNHGRRQLDGALSSIRMLPSVVRAVGDRTEVWLDSGIRSGQDVLKALSLGAKGTMIGRAYIHGLGAMGEAGVTKALEVIKKEMDITMALCGERDIKNMGRHNLLVPQDFEGNWA